MGPLDGLDHLPFRLPQPDDEMHADSVRPKNRHRCLHCPPVVFPAMGAAHTRPPVAVEEGRGGGVNGDAGHVGSGGPGLGQHGPGVREQGRGDEDADGQVGFPVQAGDDSVQVGEGPPVGDHGHADPLELPIHGLGAGDDLVQRVDWPLDADEGTFVFCGQLPVPGQATVAAPPDTAVPIGEQQVEPGQPGVTAEAPSHKAKGDSRCQAGLHVFRTFHGLPPILVYALIP